MARNRHSASVSEPLAWKPRSTLRERVSRALTVPALAGAVVFVVTVIVAIAMVWARPHAPATGDDELSVAGDIAVSPSGELGEGQGEGEVAAERVFVHVVGEVEAPGVIELPADARVEAAIDAAGGVTADAVLAGVNLARIVSDGEQIVVPDAEGSQEAEAAGSATGGGGGDAPAAGSQVNLNTADAAALQVLSGVGPALAQRIIEWREVNGRFTDVEQLLDVSGIGAKTLEGFRDQVTV